MYADFHSFIFVWSKCKMARKKLQRILNESCTFSQYFVEEMIFELLIVFSNHLSIHSSICMRVHLLAYPLKFYFENTINMNV